MTKEEIIDNIARLNSETWRDREEVRMEIGKLLGELKKALEQQPSDDCVSRQAVLDTLMKYEKPCDDRQDFYLDSTTEFEEEIKDLSPVTPTRCIAEIRFSKDDLREICNEHIETECKHGTCKDCRWLTTDEDGNYYCKQTWDFDSLDFYCADFEKRGNENEKKS